jgi:hypothetical protein
MLDSHLPRCRLAHVRGRTSATTGSIVRSRPSKNDVVQLSAMPSLVAIPRAVSR